MEFQQSHLRYMRPRQAPPPSSMADPNNHQPPVPPPPGPAWFSGQFQYHGHSPSPPPPNHNQPQWAPPPPPPPPAPYSAPPPYHAPPPYAGHHHYPPPPRPSVPPPHSQIPQSYPHQDWQNPSWGQQQGWEYPAHNNGEDWAAKARAWAAAKTSTDDQYPQSQFTSLGRMEENQYPIVNPHHSDVQHLSLPASSYQQYPPSVAPPYRAPESASFNSGYVPDGHLPFTARNGPSIGDSNASFHHQESSPSSLSVHQQEVPSSYSSVAGKEEASDQNEKLYKSPWAFTPTLQHHAPPPPAAGGSSVSMEQPHYAFGQQAAEPTSDRSDQPLDFTPRFSRDHDPHVQPNYTCDSGVPVRGIDHVSAVPSIHSWNSPTAPAAVYPSIYPSGPQVDPSLAIPSPIRGHSGPLFGRMPGQNFQPIIPSVSAPFGASTGTFPGDAYGPSGVSDRPKKASVPNWLREEIIKKKAVIPTSAPDLSEEEIKSIEEEAIDKSLRRGDKGDPADSKSIDSSRSTEEEDDEEDDVEAVRTIAINQEIKRVLTEVLLKVTDELFDEIATKVLSEDDSSVVAASNFEVSPSTLAVRTLKTSAKVLISAKTKETVIDDVSGKSTLSAPGDVLGLANYASDDDDEDDDIQKFGASNSKRSSIHQPLTTKKLPDDLSMVSNGSSLAETKENHKNKLNGESRPGRMSPNATSGNHSALVSELKNNVSGRESMHSTLRSRYSSKTEFLADETKNNGENVVDGTDVFMPKDNVEEKVVMKTDPPVENVYAKKSTSDDNEDRETRNKPDKNDSKHSSVGKEFFKEAEGDRTHMRADESHRRQDERKVKKEKTDDRNGSKEKIKEQSLKSGEKSKDADSKKRSSHTDDKEGRKETEKDRRTSGKEDGRKRDRTKDEKGERSRHKLSSDSSKHKRHRSSSVGSRGRNSKNQALVSHTNDSSDESSDDSRRKLRSRKRNLSPSPVRSRRRQVSRSPHSKHSQRRHSPYSSLETTRDKRSRSRSPARRKR